MTNSIITRALIGTALILMIPLIAMQFTQEVNWTGSDFVIMGILLFGFGCLLQYVWGRAGKNRGLAATAVILGFLYIWAELAVGVFTNLGS